MATIIKRGQFKALTILASNTENKWIMHFIFSEKEQNKCNTKELTNQEKQKFMKIE
jgi:hypothetical protein